MELTTAEKIAAVPDDLIVKFREQFHDQHRNEINGSVYDKRDIEDGMLDDMRIRCYLVLGEHDLKLAIKNTHEMLVWRNEFKVRDIQFSEFHASFLCQGGFFFYNKDRLGNNIFWNRVRFNKKGVNNLEKKRVFAYMLEQHYQRFPGEQVTFVFDMTDCGLGQADLDVLRFMINCFQHHFPCIVQNLIVYKLPWILEGIWKIVKAWLSAKAQEKVKFVSGEAVDAYVSKENRWPHMGGGMDEYDKNHSTGDPIFATFSDLYTGSPRVGSEPNMLFEASPSRSVATNMESVVEPTDVTMLAEPVGSLIVTSAGSHDSLSSPTDSPVPVAAEATRLDPPTSTPNRPVSRNRDVPMSIHRITSFDEHLLEFIPDGSIVFDKATTSQEIIEASIQIRNISDIVVAFKVKSTSMTRYRSRPCAGFIQPKHSRNVHISSRFGDRNFLNTDRFLIQYMTVDESNINTSVPPASAASKMISSRKSDQKLFEKRIIPSAAPDLSPIANGSAMMDATPTPTSVTARKSTTEAVASKAANQNLTKIDETTVTKAEFDKSLSDMTETLLNVIGHQRRQTRLLNVLLFFQVILIACMLVFQMYPNKFLEIKAPSHVEASSPATSSQASSVKVDF